MPKPDYRKIAALEAELGMREVPGETEGAVPCRSEDHTWVAFQSSAEEWLACTTCGLRVTE